MSYPLMQLSACITPVHIYGDDGREAGFILPRIPSAPSGQRPLHKKGLINAGLTNKLLPMDTL